MLRSIQLVNFFFFISQNKVISFMLAGITFFFVRELIQKSKIYIEKKKKILCSIILSKVVGTESQALLSAKFKDWFCMEVLVVMTMRIRVTRNCGNS